jgi:hypothetical protein
MRLFIVFFLFYSYSSLSRKRTRAPMRLDKCSLFLSLSLAVSSIIFDATFSSSSSSSFDEDEEDTKPASNEASCCFFSERRRVSSFSSPTPGEKKRKIFPPHRQLWEETHPRKSDGESRSQPLALKKRNPKSRQSRPSSRREGESFGTRPLSRSCEVKSSERVAQSRVF